MSKPLVPLSVSAPGFLGLNTQRSGGILPPGWATVLSNFIYDDLGRIASRRGSRQLNGTVLPGSPAIQAVHEYIDASGNIINIFAADNAIWTEVSGVMTDVSGSITTPTDDFWQFVNFNGNCVGFQEGHAPIVATSATAPAFADSGGTQFNGSMVMSAYGRLWTVLDNTLRYSDLLINNFAGGSSGNFDLSLFWPNGMDEAVAITDFNGYLVVFGKESIIIYENADDVTNMAIVEGISGTGCIARDSVQIIGKDLVYLSSTGLRSLGRTLQNESLPLTDISRHVRDELLKIVTAETSVEIKSVYNRDQGFYLLTLPGAGKSFYFDLKFPNQDGSWKATTWDIAPTAIMYTQGLEMLMAVEDGYLSEYRDFIDGSNSSGVGGSTYLLDYEGTWNDFGEDAENFIKILKSVNVLGSGTVGSVATFKWAVDYSSIFSQRSLAFSNTPSSQFGVAQFSIDLFGSSSDFERIKTSIAKSGQVVKIGMFTVINGNSFAIQRIDVLAKLGKLGI